MDELIREFTVERIGKSGTKFDPPKARWFNQQYLHAQTPEQHAVYLQADLKANGIDVSDAYAAEVCTLVKDRTVFAGDFWKESEFIFSRPTAYDEAVATSKWSAEAVTVLNAFVEGLAGKESIQADDAKHLLHDAAESRGIKVGKVMQAIRLAITGRGAGPDLMHIIQLLGPTEVAARATQAVQMLTVVEKV
jgi:glutamyl-tRNA synthetase